MELLPLVEKYGLPLVMLAFMTWMFLRSEKNHREDKERRDKQCEEERNKSELNLMHAYDRCDENSKETRALHLAERKEMWEALKEVSARNTRAVDELTAAIKVHQRDVM